MVIRDGHGQQQYLGRYLNNGELLLGAPNCQENIPDTITPPPAA